MRAAKFLAGYVPCVLFALGCYHLYDEAPEMSRIANHVLGVVFALVVGLILYGLAYAKFKVKD